jgi:hypothetical protein
MLTERFSPTVYREVSVNERSVRAPTITQVEYAQV